MDTTPIPADDAHVQHQWILTHPDDTRDDVHIELWTDDYTVRVDGGDGEDSEQGRPAVNALLAKYRAAGYRVAHDYPVNDPATEAEECPEPPLAEPADRPEKCPECGSEIEYQAEHAAHGRSGPAWLCLGCRWGEWISP
ncbi:hypothetical protein [Streptomyces sp. CS014]|uniref:hypothetical protein n=1 Tax=Streptomyces sp. CS014 TaxID=2162707 RepID=UPI0013A55C2C|nr:hypothetical protein [Streptomyces sp. CS014]